jgi:hypothetical protein
MYVAIQAVLSLYASGRTTGKDSLWLACAQQSMQFLEIFD